MAIAALALLTAALRPALGSAAEAPSILLLASSDAAPMQAAIEAFRTHVAAADAHLEVGIQRLDADKGLELADTTSAAATRPALIVALGTPAARAAEAGRGDIPLLAALILDADVIPSVGAAGLLVVPSLGEQLRRLREVLPNSRRVGVIYSQDKARQQLDEVRPIAADLGFELRESQVSQPEQLPLALDDLLRRIDVLLLIPDPLFASRAVAEAVLLATFRAHIACVGLSEAWVRAGALYALQPDYAALGAQSAELALRIVGGERPETIQPQYARDLKYVINRRIARHLRTDFPAEIQQAAVAFD